MTGNGPAWLSSSAWCAPPPFPCPSLRVFMCLLWIVSSSRAPDLQIPGEGLKKAILILESELGVVVVLCVPAFVSCCTDWYARMGRSGKQGQTR